MSKDLSLNSRSESTWEFLLNSLVVLCNTELLPNQDYVCLSHCWGDTRPLALNKTTYCTLVAGVHLEALPKTFQDSITVARSLEIQYIWIDSLYAALVLDMYD